MYELLKQALALVCHLNYLQILLDMTLARDRHKRIFRNMIKINILNNKQKGTQKSGIKMTFKSISK